MKQNKKKYIYDLSSENDIKLIRKRCYRIMTDKKFGNWSDDFFKFVYICLLENRNRRSTFDQMSVDFIRNKMGRTGDSRPTKGNKELRERMALGAYAPGMHELILSNDRGIVDFVSDSMAVKDVLKKLSPLDRIIINLYYVHGYNMKEIGGMMLQTEASVCKQIDQIIHIARLV